MSAVGKLYLIPTVLGDTEPLTVLPYTVKNTISELDYFIVENEKTARHFIKKICPEKKTTRFNFFRFKQKNRRC